MKLSEMSNDNYKVTKASSPNNKEVLTASVLAEQFNSMIEDDKRSRNGISELGDDSDSVSLGGTSLASSAHSFGDEEMQSIKKMAVGSVFLALIIIGMGVAACTGFILLSSRTRNHENELQFNRKAAEFINDIQNSWDDYEIAGLFIHQACRYRNFSRAEFHELYYYLKGSGLDFQVAQFIPNVTSNERRYMEKEMYLYLQKQYPEIDYNGFQQIDFSTGTFSSRPEEPFYFPLQYVEPIEGNEAALGLDVYTFDGPFIELALSTWKPSLTPGFKLVQETDPSAYSVVFYHPGIPLPSKPELTTRDVAAMVVRIPSLLKRASRGQSQSLAAYIYDSTDTFAAKKNIVTDGIDMQVEEDIPEPSFLGGIHILLDQSLMEEGEGGDFASQRQPEFVDATEIQFSALRETLKSRYVREVEFSVASRNWTIVVLSLPGTYPIEIGYEIFGGVMILVACIALALGLYINIHRMVKIYKIQAEAKVEADIVSNLFPTNVRERLVEDAAKKAEMKRKNIGSKKDKQITSESIFGSKPIADFIPEATIMCADLVGFTAWSSVRDPTQVFALLEIIYHSFDNMARKRGVYKVETIGDCYVAVAGLPNPRADHALVMCRFATDCLHKMQHLPRSLETTLGPDTGDLEIRIGLHSGPVTAGVLRGDKGRFQLFGDTVNTASRIENTGFHSKIHVSLETATIIQKAGKSHWLTLREDKIFAKGKGELQTYWLDIEGCKEASSNDLLSSKNGQKEQPKVKFNAKITHKDQSNNIGGQAEKNRKDRLVRLVKWNVDVLSNILKKIMARRAAMNNRNKSPSKLSNATIINNSDGKMVLDEVKDIITLPEFNPALLTKQVDPDTIELDDEVVMQLTSLITCIANKYRPNPFHNFEHASHVTMSVTKLLSRIVNPKETQVAKQNYIISSASDPNVSDQKELHDYTFGITSDPLTHFACVFSALIHDLDHPGVPNATLVREKTPLAAKYKNKSVAEQNSVDLAWDMLMNTQYNRLRDCIFANADEIMRFRQLVVNAVMATDIIDKDLGALRKARWAKAFANTDTQEEALSTNAKRYKEDVDRKATIVIEHLIQASDVAHTMQHWHVYLKWNENFFHEMYNAYHKGHLEKDPSKDWVEGEKGFYDFYIIPLAKKIDTCGVFGVSSFEYLSYAEANRKEWEKKGKDVVARYIENYKVIYGDPNEEHKAS